MNFEYTILNLIQNMSSPFWDAFFKGVTRLGDGGLIWIAAGMLLIIYGCVRKKQGVLLCGASMLVALAIGFIAGNLILKPLIARPRPYEGLDISLLIKAPTDFSFPSGHTFFAFAFAAIIRHNYKKWGIAAYILAALIGFSRLYLYVHYPTDVIAGAVLGIITGIGSIRLCNYIRQTKHIR